MARFKIFSKDGATVRYEGKPRYIGSYLRPSHIEFSEIASDVPIQWEVGDYIEYPRTAMKYYLYSVPQVSKNARKGSYGGAFTYTSVQFYASSKDLEIAPFRDIVSGDNGIHFSTSPDVSTYEDIYGIVSRIQACMDEIYPGKWRIFVRSFSQSSNPELYDSFHTAKEFALSGGTCLDALSKIYELWNETGWWHYYDSAAKRDVILVGYLSELGMDNLVSGLTYGKGNGLTAIKKTQTNKDELATRLYVYGSERNIPSRWYNGLNIANAESVDIRNLMIPLDRWGKTSGLPDARKAYLENAEAVSKYGIIPRTHYFDSEDAGADIYPTIEGMTIGKVRSALSDMKEDKFYPSATEYPNNAERVDEIKSATRPIDDGVLKRNGNEHDSTWGFMRNAAQTPEVTISKGTNEEFAVVENFLIYESSSSSTLNIARAKVTVSADLVCRIPNARYGTVRGVLVLGSSLDSPKKEMDIMFTYDEEAGDWYVSLPTISADYVDASYVRYDVFLSLSVYATPESALANDVTTQVSISQGEIITTIDQIFDKTFNITLKQIGFDIEDRAALGEGKTISMKSGMCEGRNFVIKSCKYISHNDTWMLTCARQKDENLGMLFPNVDYPVLAGERFVLLDIAMPDLYVYANMDRLYEEGMKLLEKVSKVQYHYEPAIDAKKMTESSVRLREGMVMELSDEDIIGTETERLIIDSLNIYEDESAIPTYKVTLKEKKKVSYKGTPSATSESKTSSYGEEESGTGSANVDLTDYATKAWVGNQGFLEPESLKTINGQSLVGEGDIIISGGGGGIVNETDPIFKASPAAKITDADITKWNGKQDEITIDSAMSDTSTNPVQNKVIKAYADLHPKYEIVDEVVPPEDVEDFATKEWVRQGFTEPSDFKTINGQSIVGEGDIELNGGKVTLDTEMSDESENGVQNKVIKAYVDGKVSDIDTANLINVTYEELLEKCLTGKLIIGQKYRITDYVTTTQQEGTMSAKNQFDIIVTALDEWVISEDAMAIDALEPIGGSYPNIGFLPVWKLKYSLFPFYSNLFEWTCKGNEYILEDQDGLRFSFYRISSAYTELINGKQCYVFFGWVMTFGLMFYCEKANPEVGDIFFDNSGVSVPISEVIPHDEGKGVIYEMTDEWGNTAPYDFKNIKFKVYDTNGRRFSFSPIDGGTEGWVYTFDGGDFNDASVLGVADYKFQSSSDMWIHYIFEVCNNKIKYFPYKLKPILCFGARIFCEDKTAGSLTMAMRVRCSNNEFTGCEKLTFLANSNCILRNCKNVDFAMPAEWLEQDIQMDNIHIDRLAGTEANPIVIEGLTTSDDYTTYIGKNSQGEVKIWNPADLV